LPVESVADSLLLCDSGAKAMRRNLFWLSDDQWRQIEPHLPTDVRGKERVDDRQSKAGSVPPQ
jgi:hypothetical protein